MPPYDEHVYQLACETVMNTAENIAKQVEKFADSPAVRKLDAATALRLCAESIREANKRMESDAVRQD